jgi:hypothetical protein
MNIPEHRSEPAQVRPTPPAVLGLALVALALEGYDGDREGVELPGLAESEGDDGAAVGRSDDPAEPADAERQPERRRGKPGPAAARPAAARPA